MSSRPEKKRSRKESTQEPIKPLRMIDVTAWILRISVLSLILGLPWYFGSVEWRSQYYLGFFGVAICVATALHCMAGIATKSKQLSVPWLSWLFVLFGIVALVQSQSYFPWESKGAAPPSVAMQRWALGLADAPSALAGELLVTKKKGANEDSSINVGGIPCDLSSVPESDRFLAWSVEPLHTRGAAAALFMCGLMVWIGRMVFSEPRQQLWLFIALTTIGVMIACVGIQGAVSYQSQNFLGLKSGGSFATFVSKNSAGGFLNICVAGCLGLLGWTLLHTQRIRKDSRYRFADKSPIAKVRGFAEDSLADLNTAQITSVLCLIVIVSAGLISMCRGAAVSALGAIIIASVIANSKNQNRGNWVVSVAIGTAMIACMVGFQIDDKAYERLESLAEIDLGEELKAGRAYIWSIAWKAMAFYGLLGSGVGTFHFAYLPFQDPASSGWYYHAESLYAQMGVEVGYFGLGTVLLAIFFLFAGIQRSVAKDNWKVAFPAKLAGSYLLFSQLLHSFVDFAMILPASFIPACLLMGSVQSLIRFSAIAPSKKRVREDSVPAIVVSPKSTSSMRHGMMGTVFSVVCGFAISISLPAINSLATSDAMTAWVKKEGKKVLEEQDLKRVEKMAELGADDPILLWQNPASMRAFADAFVFEYRTKQMIDSPPAGPWSQTWNDTSPVLLKLALQREPDLMKQDRIVEFVGGKNALKLLEKASNSYAIGQTKSPLDWRLLWGRCTTNLSCDRDQISQWVPISHQIGKHNPQQLLTASVLFRDYFDSIQLERVWAQAMKSAPYASANAGKLIALERKDGEVPIAIFPQRSDVLQGLAEQTFTKSLFPVTHRLLWERARELIATADMSPSRREIWLADSSFALDDINGEIGHLREAIKKEPTNVKLIVRLAKIFLDLQDADNANVCLAQLMKLDPVGPEAKMVKEGISNL